jgi:hypothetical protein
MTTSLAPVFAALADDTRWQAIVKHLEVLKASALVETEQIGRELVHRAVGGRLNDVAHELEQIAGVWEQRLAQVKRLAEAP